MPILDTQKVTDDLAAAGLPLPQARVVTSKLEEAAQAARGDLVTTGELKSAIDGVKVVIAESEARLTDRLRTQFISLVAAMAAIAGLNLGIARLLG